MSIYKHTDKGKKPKPTRSLPTKDPYYPDSSLGYDVVDKRCLEVLSLEEQDKYHILIDKLNSVYTTRAVKQYIEELEQ